MQTNEREIIIEHALENEKSLEIMLDIIATDPKLQQIINTSLEKSGKFDFKEINMRSWYSLDPRLRKSITETVVKNSSDIMSKDNNSGNERIIIEHALKNKKNLEMTLDIISAENELSERIIKPVLEKLKDFICKGFICKKLDMSQWDLKKKLGYTSRGNISLSFGVSNQNGPISILLQSYGKYLYIGVFSSPNIWSSMNHLSCKLNKKLGKGESSEWWIWYQPLECSKRNYTEWRNKDTLIKMHTDPDCVVEDIGNHLLRIIEVAKPEIEEWVKQNPSAQ